MQLILNARVVALVPEDAGWSLFICQQSTYYIDNRQLIVFLPVSSFSRKLCVDNAATPGGISDSVTLNNSSSVIGANESVYPLVF